MRCDYCKCELTEQPLKMYREFIRDDWGLLIEELYVCLGLKCQERLETEMEMAVCYDNKIQM